MSRPVSLEDVVALFNRLDSQTASILAQHKRQVESYADTIDQLTALVELLYDHASPELRDAAADILEVYDGAG